MLSILKSLVFFLCRGPQATGTTVLEDASPLDLVNSQTAVFVFDLGTVAGTGSFVYLQGSHDDATYVDLEGSRLNIGANSNKQLVIEITKSLYRYVRPCIDRSANAVVVNGIMGVKAHARDFPTEQGTNIIDSIQVISPSEGTP